MRPALRVAVYKVQMADLKHIG